MTAHDGDADKELLEPNNSLTEQSRSVKDNGLSKVDHIPREDGIKINGAINGLKDIHWGAVQPQPPLQIQQQQPPQGATVHWERFLHVRSLKVLLVEYDDSTRHVVSALLRNSSYEVIEASNALQAWKVLEDLNNHIDLVLTEVIMPCLTGIGLLNKIMSHKTRKTVPIIMMSSHDSMGLVFKCLSKGAVDFLLKPVRKNELKNLWQHVWRRCHSSSGSGSGSESCTQTQKSIKSKSIQKSKNNSGSNDEEDNVSSGMNSGDGSDTGGGAQSSWTKRAADTGSPSFSPWEDQAVECADSTCAQVIRSNSETSQNKQGPAAAVAVKRDKHENPAISRDLKEALPRNLNTVLELSLRPIDVKQKNPFEKTSGKLNAKLENWNADLSRGSGSGKERCGTSHMGSGTNTNNHQRESWEMKGPTMISSSDVNMKDVQNDDREEQSWIELSLKRPRAAKDMGTAVKDDRNILRRSNSSAFSRYNIGSHNCKGPGGNTISSSPDEKKSYSDEKEAGHYHADPPNQCSNVGSNNINMGSTANRDAVMKNHLMVTSIKCPEPCSFRQLKGDMAFTIHQVVKEKTEEAAAKAALVQPRDPQLLEGAQPQQLPQYPDEMSMKIMSGSAPHCGSSNAFDGLVEGNAGNYSVNGSGSGSNHGSNGFNGSSVAENAGAMNLESDNGNAENDGSGNASGSGCGSGTGANQNKSAQREAALKKFRQKRIERCFHKKVRYQNRNRVADQRSIGGQFVRKDPGSSDYRKHLT